jgi:hypothetical protein
MFDPAALPTGPATDAVLVRVGRRALAFALLFIVPFLAMGVLALVTLFVIVTRPGREAEPAKLAVGTVLLLAFGAVGLFFAVRMWRGRHMAAHVDAAGVWLYDGTARQGIPWSVLAGVGVYWSRLGKANKVYSLEFCPAAPVDERDPVLWALIRDEEPLRPGLPSQRYRLVVPKGCRKQLTEAVRRQVPPHLWFGVREQSGPAYLGRPEVGRRPAS